MFNAIQCVIYLYSYGGFLGGTPKSSILIGFFQYKLSSYWGSPMTGNPQISVITNCSAAFLRWNWSLILGYPWYRSNAELQAKAHAAKRRPGVGVGPQAPMDVATPAWKSMVSWVCDEHLLQEDYELLGIIIPGFCFGQAWKIENGKTRNGWNVAKLRANISNISCNLA